MSSHRLKHDAGSEGWIAFDATVEEAEELFQTQYYHWSHPKSSSGKSFPAVAESAPIYTSRQSKGSLYAIESM